MANSLPSLPIVASSLDNLGDEVFCEVTNIDMLIASVRLKPLANHCKIYCIAFPNVCLLGSILLLCYVLRSCY